MYFYLNKKDTKRIAACYCYVEVLKSEFSHVLAVKENPRPSVVTVTLRSPQVTARYPGHRLPRRRLLSFLTCFLAQLCTALINTEKPREDC